MADGKVPLLDLMQKFSKDEMEKMYPGLYSPGGTLRHGVLDASGHILVDPPSAQKAIEADRQMNPQPEPEVMPKKPLDRDGLLTAAQRMLLQKAAK